MLVLDGNEFRKMQLIGNGDGLFRAGQAGADAQPALAGLRQRVEEGRAVGRQDTLLEGQFAVKLRCHAHFLNREDDAQIY